MILLKLILWFLFLITLVVFVLIFSPIKGEIWCTEKQIKIRGKYIMNALVLNYEDHQMNIEFLGFKFKNKSNKASDEDRGPSKKKKIKKKKKKTEKKKRKRPNTQVILLSLKLIKKLIKKILPNELKFSVALGLDDPYDTGMVCLVNQVIFMPLNQVKGYEIRFNPLYDELNLKLTGHGKINVSVASLLYPIMWWGLKKPIRHYFGWTFKRLK